MKVRLMDRGRDFDPEQSLPAQAEALEQDLELGTLLDVIAQGDGYLRTIAQRSLLSGLQEVDAIRYRQQILADCLKHPAVVRALYQLAVKGVETKRDARFYWFRDSPDSVLQKSIGMLGLLADGLRQVRQLADENASGFDSEGFTRLFTALRRELDEEYLQAVAEHLHALRFRRGAFMSASLGRANRGTNYVLRKPEERTLLQRITPSGPAGYSFTIGERDEYGMQALADLRGRGIGLVANALAQSTDHVLGFFGLLRAELGFYVGCLNLHDQLVERGVATCFPDPLAPHQGVASAGGLRDAALAFHLQQPPVGNDVDADRKQLVIVTGANQGGKTTFLRSVGLAQLMMQAGMFVAADWFRAPICRGLFTHFKREEDPTMTRGKLEEELHRMSDIADQVTANSLLLCNESFAATNEREGSEIAHQVLQAMTEAGVRVVFVTHLHDLAERVHRQQLDAALFLRAERTPDGNRSFRIIPGEPLPTSYGQDSYRRIFGLPAGTR
jgi:DNA mismatch repair ATPase MutS